MFRGELYNMLGSVRDIVQYLGESIDLLVMLGRRGVVSTRSAKCVSLDTPLSRQADSR